MRKVEVGTIHIIHTGKEVQWTEVQLRKIQLKEVKLK